MPSPEQNTCEDAFCAAQEGYLLIPLPYVSAEASEHRTNFLELAKLNNDRLR